MTDLSGQVAVITGGNSGIGKETAVELAGMGAHVVIAARNPTKAAAAVKEVKDRAPGAAVEHLPLDLASFASVRAFAGAFTERFDHLDVLVNNAGVVLRSRTTTEDGHETQFQVNHLSHFLLTNLLREQLAAAPAARVVNVSSTGHTFARDGLDFDDLDWERRRYRGFLVYCATKLANVLFTRELANRWPATKVTANAVHPGFVGSNFAREGDMGVLGAVGMVLLRPFAFSSAAGAHVGVPRVVARRERRERSVLLQVPGHVAVEGGARRRGRREIVGRERRADRHQLRSGATGRLRASRHEISAATRPRPAKPKYRTLPTARLTIGGPARRWKRSSTRATRQRRRCQPANDGPRQPRLRSRAPTGRALDE